MKCPRCGAENNDDARFCKDCGETFSQNTENQQAATPPIDPGTGYQAPPVQGSGQPQDTGAYQPPQGAYQPPQGAYQQPPQGAYQPPQGAYQQPGPGQQPYYGQPQMPPPGPKPMFNMTSAILATIFGFLCSYFIGGIFGIIAISKGNRTDSLWAMGDYQGAYNAAAEGNKYVKIAWIIGAVGFVFSVILGFVRGFAGLL